MPFRGPVGLWEPATFAEVMESGESRPPSSVVQRFGYSKEDGIATVLRGVHTLM
jgi:hypothetical protein